MKEIFNPIIMFPTDVYTRYFVDKCLERMGTIIQKTIRDDFCKFDKVTKSLPDFSMAADGLTDREKTGETVIISKFSGARLIHFPVHLKKHKRSKNLAPDASVILAHFDLALRSAGIGGEDRLYNGWT